LKENKFTDEGNDVQELLDTYKEQFEAAVITVEPPDEFVKLITLDNLEDEEIDADAYYNQKLWALLFHTTSKSANRTVRQFVRGEQERPSRVEGPSSRIPAPIRTFENRSICSRRFRASRSSPTWTPSLNSTTACASSTFTSAYAEFHFKTSTFKTHAVIGALSRAADTTMYNELIYSLINKQGHTH
jgi:hypothetical protein